MVIFHEDPPLAVAQGHKGKYRKSAGEDDFDADAYLARLLEYLETPQLACSSIHIYDVLKGWIFRYLRKALFPMHPALRLAGILPPLDMPHHLRKSDSSEFREGVVLPTKGKQLDKLQIDVGLDDPVEVTGTAPEGTRVTVQLSSTLNSTDSSQPKLVAPDYPTVSAGIPWGYSVRITTSLSSALSTPDLSKPYDLLIGLSERGQSIHSLPPPKKFPKYSRALIILGGLSGLELSIAKEKNVLGLSAEDSKDLFDFWVNICPHQGSRTIRTEEALGIGLAGLQERLLAGQLN